MRDHRSRALFWSSYALFVLCVSLAGGYWIGKHFFTKTAGPAPAPAQEIAVEPTPQPPVEALIRSEVGRKVLEIPEPGPDSSTHADADDAAMLPISLVEPRQRGASLKSLGRRQLDVARDLLDAKDIEAAVEAYRAAVALYPSVETHGALGAVYFKLAAKDLAYIQFRKAVELDPYNADLWLDLASAEHLRTAVGQSRHAAKKAREVEPGIQIVRDDSGFYRRADSDPKYHASRGSFLSRRIP